LPSVSKAHKRPYTQNYQIFASATKQPETQNVEIGSRTFHRNTFHRIIFHRIIFHRNTFHRIIFHRKHFSPNAKLTENNVLSTQISANISHFQAIFNEIRTF
jgi:hypothetical protein